MYLKQTQNPEVQVTYDIYNAKVYPRRGFFNERGAMGTNESPMHIYEKKYSHENTGNSYDSTTKFNYRDTNIDNRNKTINNSTSFNVLNASRQLSEKFDPVLASTNAIPVAKNTLVYNSTSLSNSLGGPYIDRQTSGNMQEANLVRNTSVYNDALLRITKEIRSSSQEPKISKRVYLKGGKLHSEVIETNTDNNKNESIRPRERKVSEPVLESYETSPLQKNLIIKPQKTLGVEEPYQSTTEQKQPSQSTTNYYYHFKKNLENTENARSQGLVPAKKCDARRSVPDWSTMQQLSQTIDTQILTKLRWRDSVKKHVLAVSPKEDREIGSRSAIFQKNARTFKKN